MRDQEALKALLHAYHTLLAYSFMNYFANTYFKSTLRCKRDVGLLLSDKSMETLNFVSIASTLCHRNKEQAECFDINV